MPELNEAEREIATDLMKHAVAEAVAAIRRVAMTSPSQRIANEVVSRAGRTMMLQHLVLLIGAERILPGKEYEYTGIMTELAIREGHRLRDDLRSGKIPIDVLMEAAADVAKIRG